MSELTLGQIGTFIKDYGLPFTELLVFIIGGYRRWWVWGYQYAEKAEEAKEWKTTALRLLGYAEKTTTLVQEVAGSK